MYLISGLIKWNDQFYLKSEFVKSTNNLFLIIIIY